MNNQYEIELEGINNNVESYYVDQSMRNGAGVFSAYLPYGIRCIDSDYCNLIRNINEEIKQIHSIVRRKLQCSDIKTRELFEFFNYYTWYEPIELNGRSNGHGIVVEWENGNKHEFIYGGIPKFDLKTRKSDPEQLRKEIKENPHLHNKIKENLLGNLDNYLKK